MKRMLSRFLAVAGLAGTLWTIGGCLTAVDKPGDVDRDVAALAARLSPTELSIVKTNEFQGFSRLVVMFRGHEAWIVSPKAPAPGRKWVWCMKWPGAFAQFTGQVNALERGYYYVFLDDSQWMNPEGTKRAKAWRDLLVNELGFKKKTHLIGMSWGGFFSTRYASTYPEDVENIYLDCPVLGFHDFQFRNYIGNKPCWSMDPKHDWYHDPLMPVNRAEIIAKAGIPILLIYGGKDVTVPPKGNCELFLPRFKAAGGIAEVYCRPDWQHHPHGFTEKADRGRVIDFFESPARKSSFTVISDVVIYGSSPAAFSAAIQTRRMNRSATIVSPEKSAAAKPFSDLEQAKGLVVHRGKSLDREKVKVEEVAVEGQGRQRIVSFVTTDGVVYVGKMFVDATTSGDLGTAAGVVRSGEPSARQKVGDTVTAADYGALVPKKSECTNLFIPAGANLKDSALLTRGQVSGAAAVQAIETSCAVQDVPYSAIEKRIRADGPAL